MHHPTLHLKKIIVNCVTPLPMYLVPMCHTHNSHRSFDSLT